MMIRKRIRLLLLVAVFCGALASLTSCNHDVDPQQEYTGVPLIILDTDIGSSTDDLFRYSTRGYVTVSNKGETFFHASPNGYVRYQLPNEPAWNAEILERIRTFTKLHAPDFWRPKGFNSHVSYLRYTLHAKRFSHFT